MESYYEINVSVEGQHLFATAPRSIKTEGKAAHLLNVLRQKFPTSKGFEVTCTYWHAEGKQMNWETSSPNVTV